ncbi:hypothetical protein HY345_01945 [Candidatus Microgenomates bacterium]|nr:hypothetical protein [Candidatus Microgenomates bacterium]
MKKKVIILVLTIIIIGAFFYYVIFSRGNSSSSSKIPIQVEQTTLQTQTLIDNTVTYKVTPKNFAKSAATWDFDINLDTHTGNLDQDLVDIARLVDDKGNEYKATTWEGAAPGGHHREGVLKFLPITPHPAFIELKILNNSLRWNI